jgi:hypothetical protein
VHDAVAVCVVEPSALFIDSVIPASPPTDSARLADAVTVVRYRHSLVPGQVRRAVAQSGMVRPG